MKSFVVCLGLISSGALLATHASAQSSAPQQPGSANKKAPPGSPTVRTATANATASAAAPIAPIHPTGKAAASGEGGLVAQASPQWIQSPADGFEYER